ncbi:PAS domain S-box protein [Noviherbaspirillum autotrophicum]|uniref:PAS domain S-box protein n=1 Tax=Noviherbaspirillum autotrophicum TaxID=709839 RepID=UPI00069414E0|nr:PAS domain S-box protein [Noviherbaspirillum autotrophicum]
MIKLDELVEAISREIGLDQDDIAQRKSILEISESDLMCLRHVHARLARHQGELVGAIHAYLEKLPVLGNLIGDATTAERLKHAQSEYFIRLSAGEYDLGYFKHRLRVGAVHQHIGLEPKWYVGAYRKYLSELTPLLLELMQDEPDQFWPTYNALLKVVCLDIVLALDTYFQIDRQAILSAKQYTEEIIRSMPSGLMVLDAQFRIRSVNRVMSQMFGIEGLDQIAGADVREVIPNAQLGDCIREVSANGGEHTLLVAIPGASDVRHVEFKISAALLGQESILLLMAQDVTERVRSQEEMRRFRMALDSSIDAVYLIDRAQMRFIDVNETACVALGYTHQELLSLGPQHLEPGEGEMERLIRCLDDVVQSESKTGMIRTAYQRKDGSRQPVEVYLRSIESEGGQLLLAVARDMTQRLQAEAVLRESEERFRVAFNQAAVGLAHVGTDGRWLMVNRKLCQIVGYTQQELLGMSFRDITHPDDRIVDRELARSMFRRELDEKTREKRYRHKNGYYIWVNVTSSTVRDEDGNPKYFSTVVEDISRRKQIEEELLHLANHDALTHLPNRSLLLDRLSQALVYANRSDGQVAVLVIDLDRFKNINDSLGHDVGDRIIIEVGRRLLACAHEGDTIARVGGDEFVVLRPDVQREETAAILAREILEALACPMTIAGHEFYPTASIGIGMYPKDGQDGQALLKNADTAMYRAKDAGRNNFQFYAHEMNSRALDRLKLESGLRRALERK